MSTPDLPQSEITYVPKEMEILAAIQDASMKANLPFIIAILKHLSSHTESTDKKEIIQEIIEDKDLKDSLTDSGSMIRVDEVGLDNSIKVLISQNLFLSSTDDKIGLTVRGIDAAKLLGLME